MGCRVRKHFIHSATKNTATALNMAQQIWENPKIPHQHGLQELIYILNNAALALQRVCDSIDYKYNEPHK